jgi:hypothetical protein
MRIGIDPDAARLFARGSRPRFDPAGAGLSALTEPLVSPVIGL